MILSWSAHVLHRYLPPNVDVKERDGYSELEGLDVCFKDALVLEGNSIASLLHFVFCRGTLLSW